MSRRKKKQKPGVQPAKAKAPEPLTIDEIIAIAKKRGFTFRLLEDGAPAIRGSTDDATPALLRVLAMHRVAILARIKQDLSPQPQTQTGNKP